MAASARDVLVSTDWVLENIDNPDVRIVDVDEDTEAYGRGHIRNAVGVHWKNDLQDPLRRDFIDPEGFASLLDELGITPRTTVVLYGGNNNWFAAYAYWYFRYYGHGDVRLVDGGRKKWELEGRELTQDPPKVESSSGYPVPASDDAIRAFRDYIKADVLGSGAHELIDVRSPEEFRGELLAPAHLPQEQSQKPGHIPGAHNVPWGRNVNADTGEFLSAEKLREIYEPLGVVPDKEIVAYCRIGERSALTWFVLHELLGYQNVRNYDGSWTEWGSLVGAPIER